MLDRVPFGCPRGVVADRDAQPGVIGQALQFALPQPWPIPIAPARVGFDQQVVGLGIDCAAHLLPPSTNRGDGEFGGGGLGADADQGLVGGRVIDPVGRGPTLGIAGKIIGVDDIGLTAIARAGILEGTDPLGFLGVYADDRLIVATKLRLEPLDEPILLVALRMCFADQPFDIGLERIAQRLEQSTNGGRTTPTKTLGEGAQAAARVLGLALGITTGFRLNEREQIDFQARIFFLKEDARRPRDVRDRADTPISPSQRLGDLGAGSSGPSR